MTLSPQQHQILDYVTQFELVSVKELQRHFGSRGAVTNAYKMKRKGILSIEDGHIMLAGKTVHDLCTDVVKVKRAKGTPENTSISIFGSDSNAMYFVRGEEFAPHRGEEFAPHASNFLQSAPPQDKKQESSWIVPGAIIALALSITLLSLTLIQL